MLCCASLYVVVLCSLQVESYPVFVVNSGGEAVTRKILVYIHLAGSKKATNFVTVLQWLNGLGT
jgi:hypothetical protein